MNFDGISERQFRLMEYMCGNDITRVFSNNRNLAVVIWGKGSGKDTCISILFCYFVYYLLCLYEPSKAFGLGPNDYIDIINAAASREQATLVFFEMLKNRILNWKWLKEKYKVSVSAASVTPVGRTDSVSIYKNLIVFPKNIRLFSAHTNLSSLEGRNVLVFVLDEADGMRTEREDLAEHLYRLLRTSAVSRFGTHFKGFIITYPRYKDSFSLRLFKKHAGDLSVYTDKAATWEVKPPSCFSGKFFRFKDHLIPIEFKEDFEKDPFGAMTCYMCTPVEVESPFIELPQKIDACATSTPIALFEDYVEGVQVKKRLVGTFKQCAHPHVIGIDLGLRNDSACLSVVHVEKKDNVTVYVQDLLLTWTPNYSGSEIVSFKNVAEVILEICKHLRVLAVVFDRWNSAMIIEELRSRGITSYDVTLTLQDYFFLKEQIYQHRISLVPNSRLIEELKQMVILKGKKVDHLPQYSKDCVDSLVCALHILHREYYDSAFTDSEWTSLTEGDFIPAENAGFRVIK